MGRNCCIPASYLILNRNDKFLLIKRYNTKYEDGKYSVLAGHVEPNESFTQCVIREAKEEAGIVVEEKNIKQVHTMHRKVSNDASEERIDVFFMADTWIGTVENKEPSKCSEFKWATMNYLPDNTIDYIKQAMSEISKGKNYSEYGW